MALLFNLSAMEVIAISAVALLVFGRRLPQVVAQAVVQLQRMRRSLSDLRRETGIDREIWEARRAIEDAIPRDVDPGRMLADSEREIAEEIRKDPDPPKPPSPPTP